jgi:tRNA-splicing ligase RtcB
MQVGCVDGETEFFTGKGWKKISDYVVGDLVLQYNPDASTNLVFPDKYIELPAAKLTHFEHAYGLSQTLCDNHRVVYETRGGNLVTVPFSKFRERHQALAVGEPNAAKFRTSFSFSGAGVPWSDEYLRVHVAFSADGTFPSKKIGTAGYITLKKPRKIERLHQLLQAADLPYEVKKYKDGTTRFKFYPLLPKGFTQDFYGCSSHQLQLIRQECLLWDGNQRNMFYTTLKEQADFVQFACAATGVRASVSKAPTCYRVILSQTRNTVSMSEAKLVEVVPKDGKKYCFTVPSGMLVLRNQDCIFVTGNCLVDDTSMAMAYNKLQLQRPIIGTGIIINGQPKLLPMVLRRGGRWDRRVH